MQIVKWVFPQTSRKGFPQISSNIGHKWGTLRIRTLLIFIWKKIFAKTFKTWKGKSQFSNRWNCQVPKLAKAEWSLGREHLTTWPVSNPIKSPHCNRHLHRQNIHGREYLLAFLKVPFFLPLPPLPPPAASDVSNTKCEKLSLNGKRLLLSEISAQIWPAALLPRDSPENMNCGISPTNHWHSNVQHWTYFCEFH